MLPDASGMEAWRDWHRCAGLDFSPLKKTVNPPDANTRLQAVISGDGIALLDELGRPEIEAGQMVKGLRNSLAGIRLLHGSWGRTIDYPRPRRTFKTG